MKRRAKMADQPRKWFSRAGMHSAGLAIKLAPAKTALCLLSLALVPVLRAAINDATPDASAPADASSDQPYSAIWVRNVFDLKPAPPPPSTTNVVNLPPPNVKLEGITTIFGNKRAYLSVVEPAPPGHPVNKEEFWTMTEGERHGSLEVLEINPPAATAKIKIDENISVIAIETNKPAGGGAPPPVAPGGMVRSPGFQQPPQATPALGTPMQLPPRTTRPSTPGFSQGVSPQGYAQPVSATGYGYGAGAAGVSIPGSLFNQPQSAPQQQTEPAMDPTTQAIAMAASQLQHAEQIRAGVWPPVPVLPGMQDPAAPQEPASSSTSQQPSAPQLPAWLQAKYHNFTLPQAPGLPPGP